MQQVLYSTACKYAIGAVIFLARHPEGAIRSEIAQQCNIPAAYLGIVLQRLVRYGILSSSVGHYGGYVLDRNPANIRLSDLVEAIDEMRSDTECALGHSHCAVANPCAMHEKWQPLKASIRAYLRETTIDELAAEHR